MCKRVFLSPGGVFGSPRTKKHFRPRASQFGRSYIISQCHNAIIHVLWLGVTIIFQLRHHRETTCHSVGDGPHLTVAHPARQDMCQVTLYSKTNNTNSCQTSLVDLCVFLFLYHVSNRRSWKPSARLFTHISIST